MSYRADKQVIDTHTHTDTRTDTQTQAMTIPEDQNWPRVKTIGLYGLSRAHHEVNRRSFTAILLIYSNDM